MIGVGRHGPTGPRHFVRDGTRDGQEPITPADGEGVTGPRTAFPGTMPEVARTPRSAAIDGSDEPKDVPANAGSKESERDSLACIAAVDGIGPVTMEQLLSVFGSASEVLRIAGARGGARAVAAAVQAPSVRRGGRDQVIEALVTVALDPERILTAMRTADVHAVTFDDPVYPHRLRFIALPPRVLFVRGSDASLDAPSSVAVVGTRRPTDLGRRTASRIASALVRSGTTVVSGLALGIDGAAHAAVVEASGTTIAVIGGGHARLAPVAHDRLASAIVANGGAVISEHAPGVQPSRGTFPRRNRIISGLADAVVVVEAGARSGALLTAAWALEQGRECFLVPGSIEAPEAAGCLAWLRDYAGVVRVVAGIPQLLEDLGLTPGAAFPSIVSVAGPGPTGTSRANLRPPDLGARAPTLEGIARDLPGRESELFLALAAGASTADELAAVAARPIGTVLAGLTSLEARGLVVGAFGRYRLALDDAGSP